MMSSEHMRRKARHGESKRSVACSAKQSNGTGSLFMPCLVERREIRRVEEHEVGTWWTHL